MPEGLDPVIRPDQRLQICALLEPVTDERVATVRKFAGMNECTFDEHVHSLVEAGYLAFRRAGRSDRRRASMFLTPHGRFAFQRHVVALRSIAALPDPGQHFIAG